MDDKWKKRFNVLIPYYRKCYLKETGNSSWTQKKFYYNDEQKYAVCTTNVYSRLENNLSCAQDDVYILALKKLGKRICLQSEVEEKFAFYLEKIAHKVEYSDIDDLDDFFENLNKELEGYKKYVYYEEIFYALDLIRKYYQNDLTYIKKADYEKINKLMDAYPDTLRHVLMELLYGYANVRNISYLDDIFNRYDYEHSVYLPNQVCYLLYCNFYNKNLMDLIKKANELLALFKEKENKVSIIDLNVLMSSITASFDECYSLDCLNKALLIAEEEGLPERVRVMTLLNAGYQFLLKGHYGESLNYILRSTELKKVLIIKNYSCIIFCRHMLNLKVLEENYDMKNVDEYSELDIKLFEFLLNIEKRDLHSNVVFLKKNIYRQLSKTDSLYVFIIEKELERICRPQGKFASYYDFLHKFR